MALSALAFTATASAAPSSKAKRSRHSDIQPTFATNVLIDGEEFELLKGDKLKKAITGKFICAGGSCNEIRGNVSAYYSDGRYGQFGDRWEGFGTYAITNGVVIVKLEGHVSRKVFYRSADGDIVQSWKVISGPIQSVRVIVEDIQRQ